MSFTSYDPRDAIRQIIGTSIYNPNEHKSTYALRIINTHGKTIDIPLLLSEECRRGYVPIFPYIKMHRALTTYVPHDVAAAVRKMVSYIDIIVYFQDIEGITPYDFKVAIFNELQDKIRTYQKSVTDTYFMNIQEERDAEEREGTQVTFIYIITLKCDKSDAC